MSHLLEQVIKQADLTLEQRKLLLDEVEPLSKLSPWMLQAMLHAAATGQPVEYHGSLSPAAAPCPSCENTGNLQYQWKPDSEPTKERLRCYRCGWDTGWIRYGTCTVRGAE